MTEMHFTPKQYGILLAAVEKYGDDSQMGMAIEEMAEPTNAICKLGRGRNSQQDVITEIADVTIMCQQLAIIFGAEMVKAEIDRKIDRLNERMKGEAGR